LDEAVDVRLVVFSHRRWKCCGWFPIGGLSLLQVRDTRSDDWLTLDQAVDEGVVAPSHGEYVDRARGIRMPLIDAVRDELIQGRLLDVERTKQEVSRDRMFSSTLRY